jgi:hypothetical protein
MKVSSSKTKTIGLCGKNIRRLKIELKVKL